MTPHTTRGPRAEPGTPGAGAATLPGGRVGALAGAVLAAGGVWAVWRVFVGTRSGQLVDQAALEGATLGRTSLWKVAEPVLDVVSVPFIATVLGLTVVVALVRRRWLLAGQVALLLAGANLTTQVLKYGVLDRPDLGVGDRLANTLPSGHTTAAASCAVALVLVVPRRWRAVTAVLGALYAAATGVSTLVGAWHRPGDVVAAVLVVLTWVCVVRALGPAGSAGTPLQHRRETAAATLLLGGAVVAAAAAAVAMSATATALDGVVGRHASTGLTSRAELATAYAGGALGIVAAVAALVGLVLLLLRMTEPRPLRDVHSGGPPGVQA